MNIDKAAGWVIFRPACPVLEERTKASPADACHACHQFAYSP
ncbi:hypothetical protein CHCC14809_0582 [Bacillus licheniformis]|nr:hypothetical protein B4092_2338 [Bacillus licheniformis]MDP4122418.1 hypothetical protein [Bacillota bacterium]TWN16535.1 hypothetical protein CHCC14564_1100 [Bacillus licheniformis LMG 17339]KYC75682.1 hypothetical protein B4090_2368 [Bacillus licheniformis]KYC83851.1 hypothetical protein B4091_2429 [Bacillus licheniformis]